MKTSLAITVLALAGLGMTPAAATADETITARNQANIMGENIHLSDLFDGISESKDIVVASAPQAGQTLIYTPRQLRRISETFNLDAQILPGTPALSISRAQDQELPQPRIMQTASRTTFVAPVRDVEQTVEVPVLSARVLRGETISSGDVIYIDVPEDRLPRGVVMEEADIIGKAARRTLSAERPLRERDLRRPFLIEKGQTVTMVVKTHAMRVSAQGRAMEDGARGDTIRIMNETSKRVVDATVDGSGRATVTLSGLMIN